MYVYMVKILISIKIEMVEIVEMNTVKKFLVDVYGVHWGWMNIVKMKMVKIPAFLSDKSDKFGRWTAW